MMPLLDVRHLDLDTLEGRPLFSDLNVQLERDRVAVVGRNGVGKSSLLRVLAGIAAPSGGKVSVHGSVELVPQDLPAGPASSGERRRRALATAFGRRPDLLLLDEPTEDLDAAARAWFLQTVGAFEGGLVVVSHDPELLQTFEHFFVVAESGCRHHACSYANLLGVLEAEADARQAQYARTLDTLERDERAHDKVTQRRRRKKAVGRLHELDRSQSRMRLNTRRGAAQVSQARVAAVSEQRIAAKRSWARSARRALSISLPLEAVVPALPAADGAEIIALVDVSFARESPVFEGLSLSLRRDRLAVLGPNGAGKTTLIQVMLMELRPTTGVARARLERIGSIGQGASDWRTEESLLERLARTAGGDLDQLAQRVVAHRFPLGLATRPLASLSPGERTRAALIVLFQQPGIELLVLDEPTHSLDPVGRAALTRALCAWRGGLVVASHDRAFLDALKIERTVVLPRSGPSGGTVGGDARVAGAWRV